MSAARTDLQSGAPTPEGVVSERFLLVDIGNTRLKWCVAQLPPPGLLTVNAQPSDDCHQPDAGGLFRQLDAALAGSTGTGDARAVPIRTVRIARVGPPRWQALFDDWAKGRGVSVEWAASQARMGRLVNGYDKPSTLGVDRFLSALAVAHTFPGQVAVIVSAGTATTVDAIDASGCFLGGYIVPGAGLMAESLHRNTAHLPQVGPQWARFPVTTEQAIASGIVQAQAGAVHGMLSVLRERTGVEPLVILTGGARQWLMDAFPGAQVCDNLVLQGLAFWGCPPEGA